MATQMLEGGADIRFIQVMLGHSNITATEVYTQVSIRKLKEIHTATHPGARLGPSTSSTEQPAADTDSQQAREQLLEALRDDADDEPGAGDPE